MLIRRRGPASLTLRLAPSAIVFALSAMLIVCTDSSLRANNVPQSTQQPSSPGLQLVVLLDLNPHQKKVLPVELTLAEGVIQRLSQPGNAFTVITFGSKGPTLLKSGVQASEAIAAIRDVMLEQTRGKYFSVHLYDALNLAFGQFTDDARPKSLLVISEGNDYFPGKTFQQTASQAQQLRVTFDVAMVADHAFYGSKGIQRYGFDLRRLAGKTHGRYIEVGNGRKNIPRSIDRLSDSMLSQNGR
jgi:hypothetical protein